MIFAFGATGVSLMIIYALAMMAERKAESKSYVNLIVMAVSLVAAFSWEHCFHTAMDVIAHNYEVGYGGFVPKLLVAIIVPTVILPGYVFLLKPIVVDIDERLNAE